jgi:hypothetical protein
MTTTVRGGGWCGRQLGARVKKEIKVQEVGIEGQNLWKAAILAPNCGRKLVRCTLNFGLEPTGSMRAAVPLPLWERSAQFATTERRATGEGC